MKSIYLIFSALLLFGFCTSNKTQDVVIIDKESFATSLNGNQVKLFTLKNSNGLIAQITNFGGRVVSLWVPDRKGNFADVSVGHKTAREYIEGPESYFGATIGRYGNRIGKGRFVLEGDTFQLSINHHGNTLHGGTNGFNRKVWDGNQTDGRTLELTCHSPHMEEGFPGNLDVKVKFQLTDQNELQIEYWAETDRPTVVNLSNHTYFNLKGEAAGTINDHWLSINAGHYTPVDEHLIPTGEIAPVENTPMDFRIPVSIGERVNAGHEQLIYGKGYDHNWVLNKGDETIIKAAVLKDPVSGRILEVYTNEPGIQFYGGNFLDGTVNGKYGKPIERRSALCLETQHFPDSPNQSNFPSTTLYPGEKYYSICIYKFNAE